MCQVSLVVKYNLIAKYNAAGVSLSLIWRGMIPGFVDLRSTELKMICCQIDVITLDFCDKESGYLCLDHHKVYARMIST